MMRTKLCCLVLLTLLCQQLSGEDEQSFSGPQVGEALVPFAMKDVLGDQPEQELDLVSQANGGPVVIVFFRERTRPAFALTNTVTRMAASHKQEGLVSGVCFLADDATDTEDWMKKIRQYFTRGVVHGISKDGPEGPGAYGLNRNVAVTVLVGKENKVTANFALVQPSVQADGPKIFKAIVDVLGGGEVPELSEFSQNRYGEQTARLNPRLKRLIRPMLSKDATPEEVQRAAAAVEDFLAQNPRAKRQVGQTAAQLMRSGRLNSTGTEPARKKVREWARKFGRQTAEGKKSDRGA